MPGDAGRKYGGEETTIESCGRVFVPAKIARADLRMRSCLRLTHPVGLLNGGRRWRSLPNFHYLLLWMG